MESYIIDRTKTDWTVIKGNTRTIVAYFDNGRKETMPLLKFLTMKTGKRKKVFKIDCYTEGEKIE